MADPFPSLVSTQWLADVLAGASTDPLNAPDIAVLDASKHLPTARRDPLAEFETAHIPSARFLDLTNLKNTQSSVPDALPTKSQLLSALASLGVGSENHIVLYDDSAVKTSARAWFALKAYGFERVSILDGGLAKWRGEGRAVESGVHSTNPKLVVVDETPPPGVRSKADMRANLETTNEQVLDARAADRVFGTGTDPVHGGPNGRIPGSLNLPFGKVFNTDGTYKSPEALRAAFEQAGIDWTRPVVTTCGSGLTASVLLFALYLAGKNDTALYDGSWQEWGSDPDTPKAQGPDLAAPAPATKLAHAGRRPEWTGRVVNTPVWRASTHLYESEAQRKAATGSDRDGQFFYGRRGAPTQWSLADALTEMEPGAAGTVLYPSGVAAIAGALLTVLRPGDTLLMADNAYDPSRSMATGLLKRLGIKHAFFDPLDIAGFETLVTAHQPKAVWFENPGSLTMEVCDIPALTALARKAGAVSLIDNTWASSLGFQAIEKGCDIVMMSLSKHVGGHSDLMMGSCSAGESWYKRLRRTSQQLGQVVSPDDAALASRGLRTMGLRLERTTASAVTIANWLADQPQVAQVMCPMRPGDAGYDLWSRDFTGGCGLFSLVLASADEAASGRIVDTLGRFGIGYSWGGFESLALPIFPHTHREAMTSPTHSETGTEAGPRPALRLSIGLEEPGDLIEDLAQALARLDI